MTVPPDRSDYRRLLELLGRASDLEHAQSLLGWDERTGMPRGGAAGRAEQMATLSGVHHELATAPEVGELLDRLEPWAAELDPDSTEAAVIRVARHDFERAVRVPVTLRTEMARAESLSEQAWAEARASSDFAAFAPHLERMVELRQRYADCFEGFASRYDALLDEYEPQMTSAELAPLLAELRQGLVPMIEAIAGAEQLDDSCLRGNPNRKGRGDGFPVERQMVLMRELLAELPLDAGAWRLDPTVHPFAASIGPDDIRLTTRFDPEYLGTGLWSTLHEAGHGMYENGIARELSRTPLGSAPSLGFHESQSRLWENWVGRGRAYLGHVLPLLGEAFPETGLGRLAGTDDGAGLDELHAAANRVERSLIRVEADELTYNLHIALRFELELEIFAGRVAVAELPAEWNSRIESYLGLEVPDDAHGVLQDVHWAAGAFGYFPTYSLGNMVAAQLWRAATAELGDLEQQIAAGELAGLGAWLRERVHSQGRRREPREALDFACGGRLEAGPLLEHLAARFGPLYGVELVPQVPQVAGAGSGGSGDSGGSSPSSSPRR